MKRIIPFETAGKTEKTIVDVILFSGQSNMAGRGVVCDTWPETAPEILEGAGWEYRAMSKEENKLFAIAEPFGATENNVDGIYEPRMKTGSMVTAFVNSYYEYNGGIPVIAISASKGGSGISQWQPGGRFLSDTVARLESCKEYLSAGGFSIRHIYLAWCQGETDADNSMPLDEYRAKLDSMLTELMAHGVEKMFMVRIGRFNGEKSDLYDDMILLQTEIARRDDRIVMVSCLFAGFRERGLMKDLFHYYQAGYNLVGTDAGMHAAQYVHSGIEPSMDDPFFGNVYSSQNGNLES